MLLHSVIYYIRRLLYYKYNIALEGKQYTLEL